MAELYLVRHGQASFGKTNYDSLSELGKQQAYQLGRSLAKLINPTQLICGSLIRQQQTMDHLLIGFKSAAQSNLDLPIQINSDFNEFDHDNLLTVYDSNFKVDKYISSEKIRQIELKKKFHKLYRKAVTKWFFDESGQYSESFQSFFQRVNNGVDNIVKKSNRKECVVVISSAGAISMCLKKILNITPTIAFELNNLIVNTSATKLFFNRDGEVSLSFFNDYSHLSFNGVEITYR